MGGGGSLPRDALGLPDEDGGVDGADGGADDDGAAEGARVGAFDGGDAGGGVLPVWLAASAVCSACP
ncbi:hypothetical protein, partial [Bifidobacterium subtile]|uniref:hypothetical protein n=1 Tax=Bifidobacterium subtile TaxID=77635 RepID=UPI00054DB1CB